MSTRPITVSVDAPVSRALALMDAQSVHEIPVLRDRRLAGMITFDAIARRTNLPLSTKVEHLMVIPPFLTVATLYPELAEQLLAVGLRGAPVVGKRGDLLGLVSRTDLVRALPNIPELAGRPVTDVASPVSLVLQEDDPCSPLFTQIRLLEDHPLPVVNRRGRLVGAVGIADLGRVLWRREAPGKRDAKRSGRSGTMLIGMVMHTPALTVEPTATAGDAARAMSKARVSSAFLSEAGRPTGIVSQADLLGLAVGRGEPSGPSTLSDVHVQIHGLRGAGDPEILAEVDQLLAKGLRHISHHARPTFLSLHVSPHSARPGDATVHIRLHTDRGVFYATETGWNFFASVTGALDDIQGQVERSHDLGRKRRRATPRRLALEDEAPVDREVEAQIRAATGDSDGEGE